MNSLHNNTLDVLIIGAGPAGSVAAKLLLEKGFQTLIVEKARFPRFMIGESLLPHCMDVLDKAGMLSGVHEKKYQIKRGALFYRADKTEIFDFSEQFTEGWSYTYQVPRADFDKTLADQAEACGVPIHYEQTVTTADFSEERPRVKVQDANGSIQELRPRFVLDASGFGRVLPQLLDLESPSNFPTRTAIFTHVFEETKPSSLHSDYIWICVHPQHHYIWYWAIPFSNGRTSVGVVAPAEFLNTIEGDCEQKLRSMLRSEPKLCERLAEREFAQEARQLTGYSANVSRLSGPGFALLGNAGEFLDPIFSSGVTIALKSSDLVTNILPRHLMGEPVDWAREYDTELRSGVAAFRTYVSGWYEGGFQKAIFYPAKEQAIKDMICSILAGYVWDKSNPFVHQHQRRLSMLQELCSLESN